MDGLYEQIRIALHQVARRKWLALGVAWGLCLAGWLVVALIPNSYKSEARVFIQTQSMLPDALDVSERDRAAKVEQLKQTIVSSENLEKVVRRTDLARQVADKRDLAAQVARLREKIEIRATAMPADQTAAGPQENMFDIVARASEPGLSDAENARLASAIAEGLIDQFVEANMTGGKAASEKTLAFLDEELAERERALREAEQRRMLFEQKYLGSLPGEGTVSQRMAAARAEIANLDRQIAVAESGLAAARAQMASTPAQIVTPGAAGSAAAAGAATAALAALQTQLAQAYARGWTDAHPDVIGIKAQMERLRPAAAREAAEGGSRGGGGAIRTPNPAFGSLQAMVAQREAELSSARARKSELETDLARLAEQQTAEPGLVAEQARLNRDYEVLKRQYDKLLEEREGVKLRGEAAAEAGIVQFRVIDPPSRPTRPSSPNRPLFLTLILFVGIGAGVAVAFLHAQLQPTFATQNRLEEVTGLPVLGTVSETPTKAGRARRGRQLKWVGATAGGLVAAYGLLMVVELYQRSTVA